MLDSRLVRISTGKNLNLKADLKFESCVGHKRSVPIMSYSERGLAKKIKKLRSKGPLTETANAAQYWISK